MSTERLADQDIVPGPTPVEVLRYWKAKGLKVGFAWQDVWREEHDVAFTVAKVMRADVLEAMQQELERAFNEGIPFERFVKEVEPRMRELGWWDEHEVVDPQTGKVAKVNPPRRLKTIYETNMRTSRAVGQYERAKRNVATRPYLLYEVGPSERHREQHLAWHGLLLPQDDPFWQFGLPPNGWGCYLPGTRVSGHIIGASKARYAGDAIEVECKSGARLAVTPNHPVATSTGWLAAASLKVGMQCLSHAREVEVVRSTRAPSMTAGRVADDQIPARVEDVFDALATHRRRLAEVAPLDFHGEARRFVGKVDVVGSYVALMDQRDAQARELADKLALAGSNARLVAVERLGLLQTLAQGRHAPSRGIPGGSALRDRLLARHAPPALVRRIGAAAQLDALTLEKPAEGGAAHAAFVSELLERGAGDIALDEVVAIRRYPYCGHVYDLETQSGWLLADGMAASNCKCSVRTVSKREYRELVRDGILEGEPEPVLDDEGLPTGHVVQRSVPVKTTSPDVPLVPWVNKRSGETVLVRQGIDPGFDKLPGEGRLAALRGR